MNYKICTGSVLSGGEIASLPHAPAQDWVDTINEFQKGSLSSRLGIPMMFGIDAVHGHNKVYNATLFPHNVGIGATRQVIFFSHIKVILYYFQCLCIAFTSYTSLIV